LKKLLSTTALCVIPVAASAADLPVKAPVYKAPVVARYNWTGFYAGGNIGYSWGHSDVTVESAELLLGAVGASLHPKGIIGGLQAGYNWQASRNWVWGLETDFQWSGQKNSVTAPWDDAIGTGSATVTSKLTWLGTARGRIGFVADARPDVLWYGTGGLAYGRVKTSLTGTFSTKFPSNCEGPAFCAVSFSDAKTKVGWTLGGGVEAALANQWTWKVEYLYVDLGTVSETVPLSTTVCAPGCSSVAGTASYSNKMTDNIVRVGLNYRFGPGP
jgi:outer membrane immunogenic protein